MSAVFAALMKILAWIALPVFVAAAYEKWVAAPRRPKDEKGVPLPAPWWAQAADWLLIPCIFAVVLAIGFASVLDWAKQVAEPLSILAPPVGLWLLIDSWFLAPRRRARDGADAQDPVILRIAYAVLPVLVVAVIVRMITAEKLDFSLALLELSVATGVIWLADNLFFRKGREAMLAKTVPAGEPVPVPGTVDNARSFFPVAFVVLIVRAFIFEPFRIPSDSMMPTLLDGDFIVVSKYAYGLRWPVINEKFFATGEPQRGDVVVFRHPPNPEVNFIKRLVGLPGDRVEVHDDYLIINGQTIELKSDGRYNDGCYSNLRLSTEKLGEHTHQVMSCRSSHGLTTPNGLRYQGIEPPPLACDRKAVAEKVGGWYCIETPPEAGPDTGDYSIDVVPAGFYLMVGDNRDNSDDGRMWGLVPDKNLVGKATRIWFNFDSQRSSVFNWGRIGTKIE
ncbi:MAG TPA: signal peptidase I [Steroidobacteraceae bacterium]|nr:signal peptidase I [Steroidobacteraceae bacterium]